MGRLPFESRPAGRTYCRSGCWGHLTGASAGYRIAVAETINRSLLYNTKGWTMSTICKSGGAMLLLLCLAGIARGDENSVSVAGRGEIKAPPDVAYVTVYVKAEGAAMVDAAKEADQKVEELKTALKQGDPVDRGLRRDHRRGRGPELCPVPTKRGPPHPEIVRQVRIATAPEPAKVYELIDAALAAGP